MPRRRTTPTTPSGDRPRRCPRGPACPSPVHHDNAKGYNAGCRSRVATAAASARVAQLRAAGPGRVPSHGTVRRMRALAAAGWTARALAARVYRRQQHMDYLRHRAGPTVLRSTADMVAELFLELSETDGGSQRARTDAARNGWPPPEAWDIDTIDDPAARPWSHLADSEPDVVALEAIDQGRLAWEQVVDVDREHIVAMLRRTLTIAETAVRVGAPLDDIDRINERLVTRARRNRKGAA